MTETVQIAIKAGGAMVEYLPERTSNTTLSLQTTCSVAAVLAKLGVPDTQPMMVILNGAMVTRPAYPTTELQDGDALSLMPPITAG